MKTKLPLLKGYLPIITSGILLGNGLIAPAFGTPQEWLDKWPNKINYPTSKKEKPEQRKIVDKPGVTIFEDWRETENDLKQKDSEENGSINPQLRLWNLGKDGIYHKIEDDQIFGNHSCCFPPCDNPNIIEQESSNIDGLVMLMKDNDKTAIA
ncbi:MAG TPA: hypothetical protein DEG17_00210 [Cyanobacteria bacterium UBA11149]|nr:hypothetical protein [Cyanobacteria bacterium UBA11367]HBE59654.1 hypothetical protein [Cyanobacteria bacterium UBA11366]HBR75837.1 hypothetical protein [Cyanobacteria bacterium UBA11159]HBS72564.1 hypothetical protein [Cyanobacteria bacterium UBA11153]HBW87344.1 hypothetical protein [Cyanobacteria bacterium UBA11149]HCA97570.1 hypothetical protein [Cyanobacteria bacterium UBA9226]